MECNNIGCGRLLGINSKIDKGTIMGIFKKTSIQWAKKFKVNGFSYIIDCTDPIITIVDPDGWDRTGNTEFFRSVFMEKITRKEFWARIGLSTCIFYTIDLRR